MIKILAIDGGGIRGIVPALVLSKIELLTGRRISSLFDLIAGTSAGGILALGLVVPAMHTPGPRHKASNLVSLFVEHGHEIFSSPSWWKAISLGGMILPKCRTSSLDKLLFDYLKKSRLRDAVADTLITGYEIEQRKVWMFRSWQAANHPDYRDCAMTEVARATSAAPFYFPPAQISVQGRLDQLMLVDGGVFANNPAMCAYVEARNRFKSEDILLVSLGTGRARRSILRNKPFAWGMTQWVNSILDVVFDGESRAVDYQLRQMQDSLRNFRYYRFQVDLQNARTRMDDASERNIRCLIADANELLTTQQKRLREVCEAL